MGIKISRQKPKNLFSTFDYKINSKDKHELIRLIKEEATNNNINIKMTMECI